MSLTIEEMQLAPIMERRARELDLAFPGLIAFTSGRRSAHAQAHAMAVNHLLDPKAYLMRQYIHAADFIAALAERPHADSVDEVTEVFYDLMVQNPMLVQSGHLSGDCVDLRPMELANDEPTVQGGLVILWIRACPDTTDFRTREGKLRRWHWRCRSLPEQA
jgi:hypothetical protein